eukprot:UN16790
MLHVVAFVLILLNAADNTQPPGDDTNPADVPDEVVETTNTPTTNTPTFQPTYPIFSRSWQIGHCTINGDYTASKYTCDTHWLKEENFTGYGQSESGDKCDIPLTTTWYLRGWRNMYAQPFL